MLFRSIAPRVVPLSVPLWKARAALRQSGLFDAVNDAVQASASPVLREAWEYAAEISRASSFITALAPQIGLTSTVIDTLFIAAAAIDG